MATPVSVESPRVRTKSEQERELQANIQRMINLQCQEQRISNPGTGRHEASSAFDSSGDGGLALSKRQSKKTHTDLQGLANFDDGDISTKPVYNSVRGLDIGIVHSHQQEDVGKGTIDFSGMLQDSEYGMGVAASNTSSIREDSDQQGQLQQDNRNDKDPQQSTTLGSQQERLIASPLPQQLYSGYGSVQDQNHEFHYGNPDHHNIDGQDYYYDEYGGYPQGDESLNWCSRLFACIYQPIAQLLSQENLHRSFCYGAIDGLLTGSGIASAFWGLGLLSIRTKVEIRLAVVVFTVAACAADALCMAMGHMWTTYIVTSNHAWERAHERQLLEQDKADSKGRLVDMLLARGMLKIDAMSLADTLEGYPDLFVSALIGDSLLSSGVQDSLLDDQTDDEYQQQQHSPGYSDPATDFDGGGAFLGSFGSWRIPVHYDSDRDIHRNLEENHVQVVCHESRKEGVFMMLGFASFSVLPSLLWLILPLWFDTSEPIPTNQSALSRAPMSSSAYSGADDGESVNVPSLIILILSSVVWCLGVWKSQFVDSNWVVFGLETVAVLLVCISSAYCIAAILAHCLALEDFILND